jgi:DNA-binding NarL/FixJ family response regulator
MSPGDDDDKPTVVLDLNALKKQKLAEEDMLANIDEEIAFDVLEKGESEDTITAIAQAPKKDQFKVVLFDFQTDFFQKSIRHFPMGYDYITATNLEELNECLRAKDFQIVVMNYDINAKAVNQLSAQIKQKFPMSKVLIMARAISPEKARLHAQTASGASGYYQLPLDAEKIEKEFQRIHSQRKAG